MKWEAWRQCSKISKEKAMERYVQQLTQLIPTWNQKAKL